MLMVRRVIARRGRARVLGMVSGMARLETGTGGAKVRYRSRALIWVTLAAAAVAAAVAVRRETPEALLGAND